VYLGARALASRGGGTARVVERASLATIFRQGMITNILNPKVALFFLAFLPQFVDPSRGSTIAQIVVLGLIFDTSGTIVNVAVAVGASGAAGRMRANRRAGEILHKVTGVIFVGLGLRIALASRH
jgi:threonine/homoserine/homoserine lactone efflux protein